MSEEEETEEKEKEPEEETPAQWVRKAKDRDESTTPLDRPFARLLAPFVGKWMIR